MLLLLFALPAAAADSMTLLIPGFDVEELPVHLSNINNLRFSPQGQLTALGYDGRIHLLSDSDGDGLEDTAKAFWDKPTLIVPVGMCWISDGLYVSSKGKISFFPDADRDGRADGEEVLSTNWPPTETQSGNVDATGITVGKDGNLYFGLLTANYANPYQVRDGHSNYSLEGKRGTLQKLSPITRQLETVVTGIRVPYNLAFNKAGDLFVSDQEGETWCPNGNPLDELNYVIPGRNYGFPPRHPEFLPNLVSELPVVSFGPQHQSSCGFVFNEPGARQKLFGPASWEGNVLVAGESRGKIFRVRLAKTPEGYLGKEQILARANLLVTDVTISPEGDLYVSAHSGKPDWGTGPTGEGKLFRIRYTGPEIPQPVAVWAANPLQVRVAFDKPLAEIPRGFARDISIDFGEYVRAADRLETLKPPYKAVERQEQTPRGKLNVTATRLSEDRRTLILSTDPHPLSVHYALRLPPLHERNGQRSTGVIDLDYDLSGVEASWKSTEGEPAEWRGWLPHLDSSLVRELTIGSAEHERLYTLLGHAGVLRLTGRIQKVAQSSGFRLTANAPFAITIGPSRQDAHKESADGFSLDVAWPEEFPSFVLELPTRRGELPVLHADWIGEDSLARPLPLAAVFLPWAPPHAEPEVQPEVETKLAGGDYERGRSLFFKDDFRCSTCHRLRGEGATVGPDLSNLVHRDASSVLRDIREPNAMINPDFVSFNVSLADDSQLTGFVRAQNEDTLRIVDAAAKETIVARNQIVKMEPSTVSLMPSGLLEGKSESEIRDLLTFLLYEPPVRKPEEIGAVLAAGGSNEVPDQPKPLQIVLIASAQDHGKGQHDYPHWQTNMHRILSTAKNVRVENAWEWPSAEQFTNADALLFYYWNHRWTPEKYAQIDTFLARGGGLMILHSATISDDSPEELAKRIGLAAQPKTVKYLHAPITLNFVAGDKNPITSGFKKLFLIDEPYWPMIGDTHSVEILATTEQEGEQRPMMWTVERGPGRVFASIAGHYTWTHDDPLFRILIARALAWITRENSSRFVSALVPRS